jgi:hypothetical protein
MNYLNNTKVLLSALAGCAFGMLPASCAYAQSSVNIALGKTVTFNKSPNYKLCTDPNDKIQLTDGKYSSEGNLQEAENTTALWVQKGTVGWQYVKPVIITIDLGSVQPIAGASYSTAAGSAGVAWPAAIYITTSEDNKTWHYAGDLTSLSQRNGTPPADGYANFHYATHDLQTKGRYISFIVVQAPFAFVDEIEVYQGNNAWLTKPAAGREISSMDNLVKENAITSRAQHRMNEDIAGVLEEIDKSSLSPGVKSTFTARLDKDAAATAQMEPLPEDFKTILPLNDIHRDILAVRGELLAAEGQKPLAVWHQHRYAWLSLLAKPDTQNQPQLDFSMLRNQFRSDDLLLTNASGKSQAVTLQLKHPPRDLQNGWLQVYSVAWTDTAQGTPVADALLPMEPQNGIYLIDVPAGMTRKVWFTVDSSKVPAGSYKSTFVVSGAGQQINVPVSLNISKVAMNTPRMSLGMWDYTNGKGLYGINPQNRKAAIDMMRSHFVDTPWASSGALPRPDAADFDAQGNVKTKLDFSNFDQWVALWPGARHYFVFANVPDVFAGAKINTPEFNLRVGSWAKVLSAHMKELNLQPKQLGILLVDEPHSDTQDTIIAAWAKAINATAPELTLFQDPTWPRPDQAKIQDAITQADILCANFPTYKNGGATVQKYFEDLRAQGKDLWFYQCSGPVRLYDPQGYYRHQAWQAFANGATGQGFWAFGDTSGVPTSWNEYTFATARVNFAPAFLDKDTVYNSIHWDAVREGIEDNEELAMLNDAIRTSSNAAWKQQARQVLNDAVQAVTQSWNPAYNWKQDKNPGLADAQLQKVQDMLIRE